MSPDVLPDSQGHSMAAAWSLSLEQADRLRPAGLARPMLRLAAFLDAGGTPAAALLTTPVLGHLAAHRPAGSAPSGRGGAVAAEDAMGALRALHRLSLLDVSEGAGRQGASVRVHQIVQRATRDNLSPALYGETARAAADGLVAAWPDVERDTALAQAFRACASALASFAEAAGCLYRPDAHPVLFRAGTSPGESGQVVAAVRHCEELSARARHHLGADHPSALTARHNLAHWRARAAEEPLP
ncbi:hypothetical protein [Streptomyces sp. NPDC021020]|uniref:hypothetical protein n=1 Tax=Streptomyces sp. NPDC021020 TaxID=3365109 RepID=UPI00378A4B28